jgi:hypothetical protein
MGVNEGLYMVYHDFDYFTECDWPAVMPFAAWARSVVDDVKNIGVIPPYCGKHRQMKYERAIRVLRPYLRQINIPV